MDISKNKTTTRTISDLTVQICCRERGKKKGEKTAVAASLNLSAAELILLFFFFAGPVGFVVLQRCDGAKDDWLEGGRGCVHVLAHLWWKCSVWSLVWLMMRNGAAPSWYSENRMVAECSDRLTSTMIPPTCTTTMKITFGSPLVSFLLQVFVFCYCIVSTAMTC